MKTIRILAGVGLVAVAAGALGLWWAKRPPLLPPSSPAPTRASEPVGEPAAPVAATASHWRIYRQPEQLPDWCVAYGKEFWQRPAPDTLSAGPAPAAVLKADAAINLGGVIDRVSHAFAAEPGSPSPVVHARSYLARIEAGALQLSPFAPAPAAGKRSPSDAELEAQLAQAIPRTPETPEEEDLALQQIAAFAAAKAGAPAPIASAPTTVAPPDPGATARFETVALRQGDRVTRPADGPPLDWILLGNTAQARLDPASGVLEHLEADGQGVAVTWVLPQRLAADKPILIEAQLTGLTYAGKTAGGQHFADANGTARLRVGKVTAVDAAGTRWPLAMEVKGQLLAVTVPESVLAGAVYPVAIDPMIEPEFGMDSPVLLAAPAAQLNPAVAANGSTFLVAWQDLRVADTNGGAIFGTRVTAAGTVLDPSGIALSPTGASAPTVAANGAGFLVAWEDGRNAATSGIDIYGTRVSGSGKVLDVGGFPISKAAGDQQSPAATSNGADSFVVWQDGRNVDTAPDIFGARVTSAGVVTDSSGIPISASLNVEATPAVTFNGENFLVVWSTSGGGDFETYGVRLNASGVLIDKAPFPISTVAGGEFFPAVAALGTNFLVVWQDARNAAVGGLMDIFATRVSGAGAVLDRGGFAVGASSGDRFVPAVAADASDYLVVWQDARDQAKTGMDTYGARVTAAGVVTDSSGFVISAADQDQTSPKVAFNGGVFLAAWTDARNFAASDLDVYGALITPAAAVSPSGGILLSAGASAEQHPGVAANGSNYLVVWQDNRQSATSGWGIYGVRVSLTGAPLDVSALTISAGTADRRLPVVAASGANYLVVWEDYRNSATTGADIFGARVSSAGAVLDPGGIAISSAASEQLAPAVAGSGADFLVAWQDGRNLANTSSDIYGARVSAAGSVLDAGGIAISQATAAQYSPALAFNGTVYLAVWADERNLGATGVDVYGARITTAGVVSDPGGIPITQAGGDDVLPAVASAGGAFLVVWEDGRNFNTTLDDIYGARVSGAGAVLDAGGIPVSVAADVQVAPAVAASGTNYLVVWQDGRNSAASGLDVFGTPVRADGTVVIPGGLVINAGAADQQFPKLAAGSPETFLVVCESSSGGAQRTVGNLVYLDDLPVITQIALAGGSATLSWLSIAGRTYRVQFKSDLNAAGWSDLSGDVLASGPVASKTDTTLSGAARRFYRVVLLP